MGYAIDLGNKRLFPLAVSHGSASEELKLSILLPLYPKNRHSSRHRGRQRCAISRRSPTTKKRAQSRSRPIDLRTEVTIGVTRKSTSAFAAAYTMKLWISAGKGPTNSTPGAARTSAIDVSPNSASPLTTGSIAGNLPLHRTQSIIESRRIFDPPKLVAKRLRPICSTPAHERQRFGQPNTPRPVQRQR